MGRVAKILSFVRAVFNGAKVSDVKTDTGGGVNITAQHFADAGDDSHPLTTDYAVNVGVAGSGNEAAVGYLDPLNTPKATAGDKRIYARDANSGIVVVEVWLKSDSSAIISNSNGSIKLQADGTVNINGLTIDATGALVSPTKVTSPSIIANGKELAGHLHPAGTPPGNTGTNS